MFRMWKKIAEDGSMRTSSERRSIETSLIDGILLPFLYSLSLLYRIALRVHFVKQKRISAAATVKTLSVGNITSGGNGKTPFCIYLASKMLQMQQVPLVISNGYKGTEDEFRLMSKRLPSPAVVASSSKRLECAQRELRNNPKISIVILDDGFQVPNDILKT